MPATCIQSKRLQTADSLRDWRAKLRLLQVPVCATNGVFDLITACHVGFFELVNAQHREALLLVGVNDDASVRELKGQRRPINPQMDRLTVVAALECVDYVYLFSGKRATEFLKLAEPDVWIKGGYRTDTLDPDEADAVKACGGKIELIPLLHGRSTTDIIERIKNEQSDY